MKYEPIPRMTRDEIAGLISSEVATDDQKILAAYSANWHHDTDFAVDMGIALLRNDHLRHRALGVVEEVMQLHRTCHRHSEVIAVLTPFASDPAVGETISAMLEYGEMFSDVVQT